MVLTRCLGSSRVVMLHFVDAWHIVKLPCITFLLNGQDASGTLFELYVPIIISQCRVIVTTTRRMGMALTGHVFISGKFIMRMALISVDV